MQNKYKFDQRRQNSFSILGTLRIFLKMIDWRYKHFKQRWGNDENIDFKAISELEWAAKRVRLRIFVEVK